MALQLAGSAVVDPPVTLAVQSVWPPAMLKVTVPAAMAVLPLRVLTVADSGNGVPDGKEDIEVAPLMSKPKTPGGGVSVTLVGGAAFDP